MTTTTTTTTYSESTRVAGQNESTNEYIYV